VENSTKKKTTHTKQYATNICVRTAL